jgi:hypothetical protein
MKMCDVMAGDLWSRQGEKAKGKKNFLKGMSLGGRFRVAPWRD